MSKIQALLFDKNNFNERSARNWLKYHNYKPIKSSHTTDNYIRYRLREPSKGYLYRTISLTKDIRAILEVPKNRRRRANGMRTRVSPYIGVTSIRSGGSLYGLVTSNPELVNGLVGGVHALLSLATLGGLGYAITKKIKGN